MKRRTGSIRGGFTLIEVLVTIGLLVVVLPAIMNGINLASNAASDAHQRIEAAGLAHSKLSELVANAEWDSGALSGDFSPDWPQYHWQATLQPWSYDQSGQNLQELDLTVSWTTRNREQSATFSTLVYERQQ